MRFLRITTALILMLVLYATWPPNEEHINIIFSYKADVGAPEMEVVFGAGIDHSHLHSVRAGDRRRTRLIPGRAVVLADERRLYMRYYPADRAVNSTSWWNGPALPMDVSYRIAVDLHADGQVSYRYCIKPCTLPNQAQGLSL